MKTLFRTLALLVVCMQWTLAHNGSAYSRYGAGEATTFSTARAAALGGAGTALSADGYINFENPASLGTVSRTLFNAGYQYRGYEATDGTNSSYLNAGGFLNVAMAFPVYKPYGIVFAIGLSPVSTVGYYFDLRNTSSAGDISQTFDGHGGLSAVQMSLTASPMQDLYLGMTTDYLFGSITREQSLSYPNTNFYATDMAQTTSMHGFSFRLGALHTGIDKALGLSKTKHVSAGLSVATGGSLTSARELLVHRSTRDTTVSSPDGTVKIPVAVAAGLAWLNNGILLTGDVHMQQWGSYSEFGVTPAEMQNSMRAGAGIEWLPSTEYKETYWQQVSYRLGAYAGKTNVYLNGSSINEYFATAGIGLPLGNEARLNMGLEYGIRGTTSSSLVKNNLIRFTLSISAGDIWFLQPEVE